MNKKCEKIEQDIQAEIDALMKRHDVKETENTTYEDGETRELKRKKQIGLKNELLEIEERKKHQIDKIVSAGGIIWINLISFVRRVKVSYLFYSVNSILPNIMLILIMFI